MKVFQSSILTVLTLVHWLVCLIPVTSRDSFLALRSAGPMTRRSITWILCIAAIALACGPHTRHGDGDAHASVPNAHEPKAFTDLSLIHI